jgi:hypothetical protein
LFSPTYDEIIFLIWRVSSSRPRPKPSTPALLLMQVMSLTPIAQRRDQRLGNAAQAEAAHREGLAVADDPFQRGSRAG